MLASYDGDIRAYLVATLGWLKYVVLEAPAAKMRSATWMSMKAFRL